MNDTKLIKHFLYHSFFILYFLTFWNFKNLRKLKAKISMTILLFRIPEAKLKNCEFNRVYSQTLQSNDFPNSLNSISKKNPV